jgi:inosose dehydratase
VGTKSAGYRAIELTHSFFDAGNAVRTARLLEQHRLKVPVVFCGGPMHKAEQALASIARAIDIAERARPFGLVALSFSAAGKRAEQRKTDQELAAQSLALDRLGEELHNRGLRLFIHPDPDQMRENAREWRHILIHTDRQLVELCVDAHRVYRSGQDLMQLLNECGGRLAELHLRNSKNGVCLERLGEGDIDYEPVAAYLRKTRFRGYLTVELAWEKETGIRRPVVERLRMSREYAETIFGPCN